MNNSGAAGAIPKSPQLITTPQAQTFQSYIDLLSDKETNDETKLKAVQEISNNFEVIIHSFIRHLSRSIYSYSNYSSYLCN